MILVGLLSSDRVSDRASARLGANAVHHRLHCRLNRHLSGAPLPFSTHSRSMPTKQKTRPIDEFGFITRTVDFHDIGRRNMPNKISLAVQRSLDEKEHMAGRAALESSHSYRRKFLEAAARPLPPPRPLEDLIEELVPMARSGSPPFERVDGISLAEKPARFDATYEPRSPAAISVSAPRRLVSHADRSPRPDGKPDKDNLHQWLLQQL